MNRRHAAVFAVALVLAALAGLFLLSLKGYIPLTYTQAGTLAELEKFLDSPRDDMQAIKVNGHFLEIGKRRALQILPGYKGVFFLMRPYRQIKYRPRNMTRPEIVDMCLSVNGKELQTRKAERTQRAPDGQGIIDGREVRVYRLTQFTYLITGLSDKPQFMGQVELAKHLGMSDAHILGVLVPVQEAWFKSLESLHDKAPSGSILPEVPDGISAWLNARG